MKGMLLFKRKALLYASAAAGQRLLRLTQGQVLTHCESLKPSATVASLPELPEVLTNAQRCSHNTHTLHRSRINDLQCATDTFEQRCQAISNVDARLLKIGEHNPDTWFRVKEKTEHRHQTSRVQQAKDREASNSQVVQQERPPRLDHNPSTAHTMCISPQLVGSVITSRLTTNNDAQPPFDQAVLGSKWRPQASRCLHELFSDLRRRFATKFCCSVAHNKRTSRIRVLTAITPQTCTADAQEGSDRTRFGRKRRPQASRCVHELFSELRRHFAAKFFCSVARNKRTSRRLVLTAINSWTCAEDAQEGSDRTRFGRKWRPRASDGVHELFSELRRHFSAKFFCSVARNKRTSPRLVLTAINSWTCTADAREGSDRTRLGRKWRPQISDCVHALFSELRCRFGAKKNSSAAHVLRTAL